MNEREKVASEIVGRIYMAGAFSDKPMADKAEAELLALREPSEPVGWRWYCPGCESGGHGNTEPTHCPDCMEKGVVTRPLYLNPPSREREAMEGVTAYQCTNGDLYILTNANLVGAVHHFYQPFPEHAEQFGPLKTLTILEGAEDE